MIEAIDGAPEGVVAFRAVGKVRSEDITEAVAPALRTASEESPLRIVIELGPEFDGVSAGAVSEDARLWWRHLHHWKRCAVVTDHGLIEATVKFLHPFFPGDVRVFKADELDAALAWAASDD